MSKSISLEEVSLEELETVTGGAEFNTNAALCNIFGGVAGVAAGAFVGGFASAIATPAGGIYAGSIAGIVVNGVAKEACLALLD